MDLKNMIARAIVSKDMGDIYKDNYLTYATYILLERAIPDIRDGMKPINRRILYLMNDSNYSSNLSYKKSARIVGEVMGKLHPHGDCLKGDTVIYNSNGESKTLKELVDNNIKEIDIIAFDTIHRKFVKAKAHSFRIGQYTDKIYKIHFTDNTFIECTSNHPFLKVNYIQISNFVDGSLVYINGKPKLPFEWLHAEELQVGNLILSKTLDNINNSEPETKRIGKIEIIEVENEPMYDFTVDTYQNALVFTSDLKSMIIAHNSSIYGAAVLMAQDFNNNIVTIDGHGAFGSIDGDGAAAMRYTEMRLTKFAEEVLLSDIKYKVVDTRPNYSGDDVEPVVLPVKVPYILLNGIEGIAIAYATSIPPHNLGEVIDGLNAYVKNRKMDYIEMMKYIPAPDYPTKGIIEGTSGISTLYNTGSGGHILKGRLECEQNKKGNYVFTITEVPYGVKPEDIISQIRTLNELEVFKVDSVVNGSDKNHRVKIIITFHKSEEDQKRLEGILFTRTYLSIRKSYNILALKDGTPTKVTLLQIIRDFVKFREECLFKKHKFEFDKNNKRIHILEGLFIIHPVLDQVIKIIRESTSPQDAQKQLMKNFKLSFDQSDYILRMPLMRLTKLEMDSSKKEHDSLVERNKILTLLMSNNGSNKHVDKIMIDEWNDIKKKYAKPRMTEIKATVEHYDTTKLIKSQPCMIVLTKNGYIKRMSLTKEDMAQGRGGKGRNIPGLDKDDEVKEIIDCETITQLTLVTSTGKVFNKYAFDIPESNGIGRKIEHIFELSKKDKPVLFTKFDDDIKRVALVLRNGEIKVSSISDLRGGIKITPEGKSSRNKKGTKLMKLNPGDEIVSAVGLTMKGNDKGLIIATAQGKAIKLNISDIRVSSNSAGGIKGITLEGDDYVTSSCGTNSEYVVIVSKSGFAKRVETSSIRMTSRGGKGVKIGSSSDESSILYIGDKSEGLITITTSSNRMLTFDLETIRTTGKTSKGVKVANLNKDEYLTNVN